MNSPSLESAVLDPLHQLTRRVRWKRWLGKLRRFAWLLVGVFLLLFLADLLIGMRTLSLRVAFAAVLSVAAAFFIADWIAVWLRRIDLLGLAHLLEKRHPDLAERLVTLVQIQGDKQPSRLAPFLQAETVQKLAGVDAAEACSLDGERRAWMRTAVLFACLFVGLAFVPVFNVFAHRFFAVWSLPLVPYAIDVTHGNGYALRGGSYSIEAGYRMLDPFADVPSQLELLCEDETGATTSVPMTPTTDGRFTASLLNLRQSLRCRVQAGEAASETFDLRLIDVPVLTEKPSMVVVRPRYAFNGKRPEIISLDARSEIDLLEYSWMVLRVPLDQTNVKGSIRLKNQTPDGDPTAEFPISIGQGPVDIAKHKAIIALRGTYAAELVLHLEHGLSTAFPLGQWTVHADAGPRFTQPLRLHGSGSALHSSPDYRIAPDDALKLQTVVEDDEGLEGVAIEIRINDGPPRLEKWLNAEGKKKLVIDDWLPLPSALKESDRVQFRLHAGDNRRLKKGEAVGSGAVLPAVDLLPQVAIVPSASAGADAWITLRVDRSADGFLKQSAQAQSDDLRDIIGKIKKKLHHETDQVQQLQRTIHQQAVLTPLQTKQAEKLRGLSYEIIGDLQNAEERYRANPGFADLAEHFLEIAETDMVESIKALQRFGAKERSLMEAEKELQSTQDALIQATKKLDRMLDWGKRLAQDRLDQFQLEKLAKRQNELADKLKDLLANEPLSEAQMARQIEAIRQEQAKIAERMAKLQDQSRLVQESLAAMQQMRAERLAHDAEQLAAEQRAMRKLDPAKMPANLKDRLGKLAERQANLAKDVQPFADKNAGPAQAAADALKKPLVEEAIQQQKEHEKLLQDSLGKLVPSLAVDALREQIRQLAKKQKDIRADLEKLGQDLPRLDEKTLKQRLDELTARQKAIPAAIARLPIDAKHDAMRAAQQNVEQTAKQAGDQLAAKDALAAFGSMEKAQQQLEALAALVPKVAPLDRDKVKDPAVLAKIDRIEKFAREQEKLRAETERLLADWMKAAGEHASKPFREKADKLAAELMELSQKGTGPEAKAMAKESAQALEGAKKAMDASQAMKAKGNVEEAKKMDDDAAKKLDIAVKQITKLSQDPAMKEMAKTNNPKTAEALKDSGEQMLKAEQKLPTMPKDAQAAMKSAAKSLDQAARQATKQSASKLPKAARNPAAKSALPMAGGFPSSLPRNDKREASMGKTWGEMPGELKTQMLQDVRARFGAEYEEMIRQYFDRLAETPTPARKE